MTGLSEYRVWSMSRHVVLLNKELYPMPRIATLLSIMRMNAKKRIYGVEEKRAVKTLIDVGVLSLSEENNYSVVGGLTKEFLFNPTLDDKLTYFCAKRHAEEFNRRLRLQASSVVSHDVKEKVSNPDAAFWKNVRVKLRCEEYDIFDRMNYDELFVQPPEGIKVIVRYEKRCALLNPFTRYRGYDGYISFRNQSDAEIYAQAMSGLAHNFVVSGKIEVIPWKGFS